MKAFIKKLSVLFAMGALVFGSGLLKEETKVARAAEASETFTSSNFGLGNAVEFTSKTQGVATISAVKGEGSNPPKYYTNDSSVRFYTNNVVTFSLEGNYYFKSVKITATASSRLGSSPNASESDMTKSSSGSVLTYTNVGTTCKTFSITIGSDQLRMVSCVITYDTSSTGGDSGLENPSTSSISLNQNSVDLKLNEEFTLEPTVSPEDSTVVWASNNSDIVSVEGGKLTAKNFGTTTITATIEGTTTSTSCTVCVYASTVAEVQDAADGNKAILTGIVSSIKSEWNTQYNNMEAYLKDDTGTILLYRIATQVNVGNEIKVTGTIGTYNEVKQIAAGATAEVLGSAEITGITIVNEPTKTTYGLNDTLDLEGLVVNAIYGGDENISSAITSYTTDPAEGTYLLETGTIEVKVKYTEEITASFNITVSEETSGETEETLVELYKTGFESSEGHTASNTYNSTKTTGEAGKQWITYYGTPTATDKISGSQSLQMRVYTNSPSAPNSKMNFDVENATKLTFKAKNTNGINLKVYYSTDKGTSWVLGKSFTLTDTATDYSYDISSKTGNIRFKFECDYSSVSSTSRLTIDDVSIKGIKEEITSSLSSISVDATKTKLSFFVGESLKAEDIYLNGLYSGGETSRIESGFTTNPALGTIFTESDISESKIITVSYEGVEDTTYTISVVADYLTTLSRTGLDISFIEGDLLSKGDGKLFASYASGKTEELNFDSEGVEVTLNDVVIEIPYKLSLEDNGASIDINYTEGDITVSIQAYTITVSERLTTEDVQFKLVTDASTLKANDRIIIANAEAGQAISTTQANNNRLGVAVTVENNTITPPDFTSIECITLVKGTKDGTFGLKVSEGYLYAASGSKNYMRTETSLSDNSSWKIEIAADGVATVVAQGTNTRNIMRYNPNTGNGSPIFSCYESGQNDIEIYKYTFSDNLNSLINDVTNQETCTTDAQKAVEFRNRYNSLSKYEQSIFDSTIVADQDYDWENDGKNQNILKDVTVSLKDKLAYMEHINSINTNSEGLSSNLLSSLTSSNNTLIVLVVGLLGLTSILGYYFLNKKKYSC